MRPLRIAMLTYSVRPRGGVVHALEVSEALARRGHDVELMALGRAGERFFRDPERAVADRPPRAARRAVRRAHPGDARGLRATGSRDRSATAASTSIHSQDCLSANAALALRDRGRDRPRDPHRAPRRRLHLAVADRVPGPLDPRARRAAVRVGAVGAAAGATSSGSARRARPQRRRRASSPAAAPTRPSATATARAAGLGGQLTSSTSAGSSRARGR